MRLRSGAFCRECAKHRVYERGPNPPPSSIVNALLEERVEAYMSSSTTGRVKDPDDTSGRLVAASKVNGTAVMT